MALRPEILLSNVNRARCIANLKEQPVLAYKEGRDKILASVLVPMCIRDDELCLLYTLRSSNLNNHSGQVSFPGGKNEPNESVFDTALRETEEEIGFPRKDVDVWAEMREVQSRDRKMMITPVLGLLKDFDMSKLVANTDEVEEIFTVNMETLCNRNNHAHFMFNKFQIPVYLCGKHRIWGITGMITHMFLMSFLSSDIYKPNFKRKSYNLDELMPSKL